MNRNLYIAALSFLGVGAELSRSELSLRCDLPPTVLELMWTQDTSTNSDPYPDHPWWYWQYQLPKLVTSLEDSFPGSRFGFATYSDKMSTGHGADGYDYCWKLWVPMVTDGGKTMIEKVSSYRNLGLGMDQEESQLDALYYIPLAGWLGFPPPSNYDFSIEGSTPVDVVDGKPNHRFVVLTTNAQWHEKASVDWPSLTIDYPDASPPSKSCIRTGDEGWHVTCECDRLKYPEPELMGPWLRKIDAHYIFLITSYRESDREMAYDWWVANAPRLGIPKYSIVKTDILEYPRDVWNTINDELCEGLPDKTLAPGETEPEVSTTPAPGMTCEPKYDYENQLYFLWLQDLSSNSVSTNYGNTKFEINPLTFVKREYGDIVDSIEAVFPGSRIGLASFSDKPVAPHGTYKIDHCYKSERGLYLDAGEGAKEAMSNLRQADGADAGESQLDALHCTPFQTWGRDSDWLDGKRPRRIIVMQTSSFWIEAATSHQYQKPPRTFKNSCDNNEEYPVPEDIVDDLAGMDAHIIVLISGPSEQFLEETVEFYETNMPRLGVSYTIHRVTDKKQPMPGATDLKTAVWEGMNEFLCRDDGPWEPATTTGAPTTTTTEAPITTSRPVTEPHGPSLRCELPPTILEYFHLQDTTFNGPDNPPYGYDWPDMKDFKNQMNKYPALVRSIVDNLPGSYFGLASYADKPFAPNGEGFEICWRLDTKLTTDTEAFLDISANLLHGWGLDDKEGSLDALYRVGAQGGWMKDADGRPAAEVDGKEVKRIITISVDAAAHEFNGSGILGTPAKPDEDDCTQWYPEFWQVEDELMKMEADHLIILVGGRTEEYLEAAVEYWTDVSIKFGVDYSIHRMRPDYSNLIQGVWDGINIALCTNLPDVGQTLPPTESTSSETTTVSETETESHTPSWTKPTLPEWTMPTFEPPFQSVEVPSTEATEPTEGRTTPSWTKPTWTMPTFEPPFQSVEVPSTEATEPTQGRTTPSWTKPTWTMPTFEPPFQSVDVPSTEASSTTTSTTTTTTMTTTSDTTTTTTLTYTTTKSTTVATTVATTETVPPTIPTDTDGPGISCDLPPTVLEFFHIQDVSTNGPGDHFAYDTSMFQNQRQNFPELLGTIERDFPGSRYGLGAFSDKSDPRWGSPLDECWEIISPLVADGGENLMNKFMIRIAKYGEDLQDSQLDALFRAVLANWEMSGGQYADEIDGKDNKRFIVILSEGIWHDATTPGSNSLAPATLGGNCNREQYPQISQVAAELEKLDARLVVLVAGRTEDEVASGVDFWERNADSLGIHHSIQALTPFTSANLVQAVWDGINEHLC